MNKPIRIFFSPLSRRFYASRAYKELSTGIVEITGEKFDVTSDIGELITKHGVTFKLRAESKPDPKTPIAETEVKSGPFCADGGTCHHRCEYGNCFRQHGCAPLTESGLTHDWKKSR